MMMLFYLFAIALTTCPAGEIDSDGTTAGDQCQKTCGDDKDGKGTCGAGHICVEEGSANSLDEKKISVAVSKSTANPPTTFCKPEKPRCFKAEGEEKTAKDQLKKCANTNCLSTSTGNAACTITTSGNDCYCNKPIVADDGKLSAGAIAGIVIGSIIGVAALSVGGYFLYKHLTKSKKGGRAHKKKV